MQVLRTPRFRVSGRAETLMRGIISLIVSTINVGDIPRHKHRQGYAVPSRASATVEGLSPTAIYNQQCMVIQLLPILNPSLEKAVLIG